MLPSRLHFAPAICGQLVFLFSALAYASVPGPNTPPAESYACEPLVGWYWDNREPWQLEIAGLPADASTVVTSAGRRFSARTRPATWALTVEPIWIDPFSVARFSYRATGAWDEAERVVFVRAGATGPVTPGAKNPENPFAIRGEAVLLSGDDLVSDGRWHDVTVELSGLLDTHQVDQIVVSLHPPHEANPGDPRRVQHFPYIPGQTSAVPEVSLELSRLRFEASSLRRLPNHLTEQPAGDTQETSHWVPLALPQGRFPSNRLSDLFDLPREFQPGRLLTVQGIPFRLVKPNGLIPMTVLWKEDHIEIPLQGRATEIAFLMASRFFGTDSAWRFRQRTEVHQPERLVVSLHYEDGTLFQAFPWDIISKQYSVTAGLNAYVVPADPRKALSSFVLSENMTYGQIFLVAVSLHAKGKRVGPGLRAPETHLQQPGAAQPPKTELPTIILRKDLRLSNESLEVRIPTSGALALLDLIHQPTGRSFVRQATDRRLFTLHYAGAEVPSVSFSVDSYIVSEEGRSVTLTCVSRTLPFSVQVGFSVSARRQIAMDLAVRNIGRNSQDLRITFPDLRNLVISKQPAEDFYCFPLQAAVISSAFADLAADYGGRFPLQFMDIFGGRVGGLYLLTQDLIVRPKRYALRKDQRGTHMRVDYGFHLPIRLAPGKAWSAPRTVLGGHAGDWHEALKAYRSWADTWKPDRPQGRAWVRDVWICRRDYPLGGTGYLFDESGNRYTFSKLIAESSKELGGIDLIDISGWAYSETRGRVGDYDCSQLGGQENLRHQIAVAHSSGIRTGLYLEGYLVDERSRLVEQVGHAWQMVDRNGNKRFWPGNREMFMCPAVTEWQDYLSQTYCRVADETGADALYVDQFGFADRSRTCYSDRHGHRPGQSPLIGEHTMLTCLRAALDKCRPEVALYTEEAPCDLTTTLVDAAFCYGMYHAGTDSHPTKINLLRYAFPELKIIELFVPGIHPRAASEEDAWLAFFHGHAYWLKGRARSWYSKSFREFVRRSQSIRKQYSTVFASVDCEPLVPTLQPGVYANRFSQGDVTIYTLYNSLYHSVEGPLISVPRAGQTTIVDLWADREATARANPTALEVHGFLPPHGIGCIAVFSR